MKVRAGKAYLFQAAGWDRADRKPNTPKDGTLVRVVKLPGCPPPNTMGHCHVVEAQTDAFIGLVSTASLIEVGR